MTAAQTLDQVLENVGYRSGGTGGIDMLSDRSDRRSVVRFLKSTPPGEVCPATLR